VRIPMLDIKTIGTGGGSIAWLSREGKLKVGPRSAGAVPGPMCYPNGGDEPTHDRRQSRPRPHSAGADRRRHPLDVERARGGLKRWRRGFPAI
jgi:N-methylhydantoinase A